MDALLEEYDLGQELGRGSFGVVYKAKHRTSGEDVAIKVIDLTEMQQRNLMEKVNSEIKVHRNLRHPNIVRCIHYGLDHVHLYMVLELCTQGNLYTYLQKHGRLLEAEALQIINQLVSALSYMHARNVIHRDLKLSNVLITGNVRAGWAEARVKLCDFGLAVRMEHPDEDNLTMCGTANYMSPEVSKGRPHSFPADIWSAGCLLYTLVVGQPPFYAGRADEVIHHVQHRDCEIPQGYFSEAAVDLLQKMLRKVSTVLPWTPK
jgi:serine/threonine protein kinase